MHNKASRPVILDVRMPDEYDEEHVEGSINLPLQELMPATRGAQAVLESIAAGPQGKDTEIWAHCASGGRSAMACTILGQMGFANVKNTGGLEETRRLLAGIK